jgi:hypothetical protein
VGWTNLSAAGSSRQKLDADRRSLRMRRVNPYNSDPATTTFTYFYQSAHNSDRSGAVTEGAQSSTGPSMPTNFVPAKVVAAAKNRAR